MRHAARLQFSHVAHQCSGSSNCRSVRWPYAESFDRSDSELARDLGCCQRGIEFPLITLCDEGVFMLSGAIMARGSVAELIRDPQLTELYFGH